jgi:hypothetical protein
VLNDGQTTDFALFELIKRTNLDIKGSACLHVVHIFQQPTSCPTTRSTNDTMVNALKKNFTPLPVDIYSKSTEQSTCRCHQANGRKRGLVAEWDQALRVVLATGSGNPPGVRVWTGKPSWFSSRPVQIPHPLTLGGPILDPYPSTRGYRQVWLEPSAPISGSAFLLLHLWSPADMLLLIVKYRHWYLTVHFRHISCLDVQNKHNHAPNHILKASVNRASTIFGLASSVIWVVLDHKHL